MFASSVALIPNLPQNAHNMKLKLRTQSTETLKRCFSQISSLRKFVILRFSPEQLLAILINDSSIHQEPQVWCKFPMASIFSEIEVHSLRDNVILLEVNLELFLQTLRNFDRANSQDLSLRLQRAEKGTSSSSRSASLALYYLDVTTNANTINHTFRIPVKILKGHAEELKEPELPSIDLMVKLPTEFAATYRRLDKFRHTLAQEKVKILASRRQGGYLKFVLEEADSYKVTIAWNDKLDMHKPQTGLDTDSLRAAALQESHDKVDEHDELEDTEITVRVKDWKLALKIVGSCKTIILLICKGQACVIHCLLDDTEDVEMIYYISAVRVREED